MSSGNWLVGLCWYATDQIIDDEVRTLLKEIERDFDTWFKQHRQQPESLATALLEHATREADDIEVIIINPVANDRQTGGYQRCQAN